MEPTILLLLRVKSPLVSDGGGSGHVTMEERNKNALLFMKLLYYGHFQSKEKCPEFRG